MNLNLNPKKITEQILVPKHVAVIMDGNGRWAKMRRRPRTYGHTKAKGAIQETVKFCIKQNVEVLTLFAFSTENWQRPATEVKFLMSLMIDFLDQSQKLLHENQIKLAWMGEKNNVPKKLYAKFNSLIAETSHYNKMTLCLAVDYGSKAEIISAVKALAKKALAGELKIDDINTKIFEQELYTSQFPEVDLIIRTSGEYRLSNFLLWQAAYSELYFCDTLWPDITELDLINAFNSYQYRSRRWGKLKGDKA